MSDEYCQIEGCGLEASVVIRRGCGGGAMCPERCGLKAEEHEVSAVCCEECLLDGSATDRWDGATQSLLFIARANLEIENEKAFREITGLSPCILE